MTSRYKRPGPGFQDACVPSIPTAATSPGVPWPNALSRLCDSGACEIEGGWLKAV